MIADLSAWGCYAELGIPIAKAKGEVATGQKIDVWQSGFPLRYFPRV